jgi:hypothetical protein
MSYTAPDYMDDLNRALDVSLNTDNCELQATAAINEVERLQGIEKLLRDNRDRIVAALMTMQDSDEDLGHPDEAKASGSLIELLAKLPDKAPDSDYDEDEEEEEEEEDASS